MSDVATAPATAASAVPATAPNVAPPPGPATPVIIHVPSGQDAAAALVGTPPEKTREEIRASLVQGRAPEDIKTGASAGPTDEVPQPTLEAPAAPIDGAAPEPAAPKPLTYKVRDAAGQFVAPDLARKVEFTINGQTYLKTDAELVRGFAGQINASRIATENQALKASVTTTQQQYEGRLQALNAELSARSALAIELLEAAPEIVDARRQEWASQNSDGKRAERAEAALRTRTESEQQRDALLRTNAMAAQFFGSHVKPVLDDLSTKYPNISEEARYGRIMLDTASLHVNGRIPPERYGEYDAYLRGPLTRWVADQSAKLSGASDVERKAREKAEQDAAKARQDAVQAQARGMQPIGFASPDRPALRVPQTREEIRNAIVQRPRT